MDAVNAPPPFNIFHVNGNVAVPKISPTSEIPIKIKIKPTKTILINAQLLTMYLKSILDNFQVVFKF